MFFFQRKWLKNPNRLKRNKTYRGILFDLLFRQHPFLIGLFLRIAVSIVFPALFDRGIGVQYTDIDYYVFTDAAQLVQIGQSPYERHTYRYTPFLADLLALFGKYMRTCSRLLFCFADSLCGHIIMKLRCRIRSSLTKQSGATPDFLPSDSLWWLYNPLPINICTRGSAESLVVLLPVLSCVAVATWREPSMNSTNAIEQIIKSLRIERLILIVQSMICGIVLGIAIHMKIYPIIYTLSFMTYFSRKEGAPCWQQNMQTNYKSLFRKFVAFVAIWLRRLLRPPSILFLIGTVGMCSALTFLAVELHGMEAWDQGMAYHMTRIDHRHNYSVYWYWIYLLRAAREKSPTLETDSNNIFGIWSRVLFLPQIILLIASSIGMAPIHLELTLFCQTFLFVACNKVITGQYFTWYLVLLPLCTTDNLDWMKRRSSVISFTMLGISIGTWLASAYCLEMLGWSVHLQVWVASLVFFLANVNLFGIILDGCASS